MDCAEKPQTNDRPPLDPHPLSDYVAWAGRRNRAPILALLRDVLPEDEGHVLEFASGSGMHITYFAPYFPWLRFYPSDRDRDVLPVIAERARKVGLGNVAEPCRLDLADEATWRHAERPTFDAILCINLFQVAPPAIAEGVMGCASRLLNQRGRLIVYGPFRVDGGYTTESNRAFDQMLLAAGVPEWGLKDVADLDRAAARHGLAPGARVAMPANNFALIYRSGV